MILYITGLPRTARKDELYFKRGIVSVYIFFDGIFFPRFLSSSFSRMQIKFCNWFSNTKSKGKKSQKNSPKVRVSEEIFLIIQLLLVFSCSWRLLTSDFL